MNDIDDVNVEELLLLVDVVPLINLIRVFQIPGTDILDLSKWAGGQSSGLSHGKRGIIGKNVIEDTFASQISDIVRWSGAFWRIIDSTDNFSNSTRSTSGCDFDAKINDDGCDSGELDKMNNLLDEEPTTNSSNVKILGIIKGLICLDIGS